MCGECCRSLLSNSNGLTFGLVLTVKEKKLFDPRLVSRRLALGRNSPKKDILFQLNVNQCPFLSKDNNCGIYEKRPLRCREFPFLSTGISNLCTALSYRKVGITYASLMDEVSLDAGEKLVRHLSNRFKKKIPERYESLEFRIKVPDLEEY